MTLDHACTNIVIGEPDHAPERRSNGSILKPAACAFDLGLGFGQTRHGLFLCRLRHRGCLAQLASALEGLPLFDQYRLGFGQVRPLDCIIEPRQHIALLDASAGGDPEAGEPAVRLGHDVDGLQRTCRADRFDGLLQHALFCDGNLYRHRPLCLCFCRSFGRVDKVGLIAEIAAIGCAADQAEQEQLFPYLHWCGNPFSEGDGARMGYGRNLASCKRIVSPQKGNSLCAIQPARL